MTIEFFYNILPDIAGFTTSFVYAVTMLVIGFHLLKPRKHYPTLLIAMGFIAVIEFSESLFSFLLEIQGKDPSFISHYIQPVAVCVEQSMILFALMYILYISAQQLRPAIYALILFILVALAYPLIYSFTLSPTDEFFSIASYTRFVDTTLAFVLKQAIDFSMFCLMMVSLYCIVRGYVMFRSVLGMYFSTDNARVRNKCIAWSLAGTLYTTISVLAFTIHEPWMKPVHRVSVIILAAIMMLIILCNEKVLIEIENAFHNIKRQNINIANGSFSGMPESLTGGKAEREDIRRVRTIMEQWANRQDRPFAQRGVTIQSAADDMRLPIEVVHRYVNIIYGVSFREWILDLRE